jgi:CubicO group peptidase (beta-lactamase class C family)
MTADLVANASPRFAEARSVLDEAIAGHVFPGCAFGVWAEGRVQTIEARGRFTYDGNASAVAPETIFDLASVSKVVATTAAAMLLFQRGLLELDLPVGELLPGFVIGRAPGSPARRVTLRHLLAHNSGLPGYVEFFRTERSPAQLLRACLALEFEAEPAARYEYSDPGFILLGKALEVLLGEPLDRFVGRAIFAPLGMSATGYCPAPQEREKIPPTEEDKNFRGRRIQGEVQDENAWVLGGVAGHAGVFSNVGDLLRFSAEILEAVSPLGAPRVFHKATVEQFATRQGPEGSSRALGWDTPSAPSSSGSDFSPHSVGHLGYSGCSLWIDLDAAISVVLLTNRTWPDRSTQQIKDLRPAFHNAVRRALPR